MAAYKARELTVKVDVDVSEALTGLKALQREAKKATQALRELESAQKAVKAGE
jgi:phage-related minor tail protein